ncbi:hypothetical protein HDU91_005992 [Kappamyces sp. JEL0680]|nr:hypothetical protein HDU91_005992 [Kappamyces sp. JEL0680]
MKLEKRLIPWTLLLIPAVFLLSRNFQTSEMDLHVFKRDLVSSFTYSTPSSPLSIWVSLAKLLRMMSHFGQSFPLNLALSGNFTSSSFYMYYAGFAGLLALLFLGLLIIAFAGGIMCCNQCCCKNRLRRKYEAKKPPGTFKKTCAYLCMVIPYLIVGICIYIHIIGSNYITYGLANVSTGISGMVNAFSSVLQSVPANFGTALDTLDGSINSSIDATSTAVDYSSFYSTVSPPWNDMVTSMYGIANDSITMNTYLTSYASDLATLQTNIASVNTCTLVRLML